MRLCQTESKGTLCTCEHKYTAVLLTHILCSKILSLHFLLNGLAFSPRGACVVFASIQWDLSDFSLHCQFGLSWLLTLLSAFYIFFYVSYIKSSLGECPGLWAHLLHRGVVVRHQMPPELLSRCLFTSDLLEEKLALRAT